MSLESRLAVLVQAIGGDIKALFSEKSDAAHLHDSRYVRTVNGSGPDASGNVTVTGGGGPTITTAATAPSNPAVGDIWFKV